MVITGSRGTGERDIWLEQKIGDYASVEIAGETFPAAGKIVAKRTDASAPEPPAGSSATEPVWLPVRANSADYQKLAGPELVLIGRIEVSAMKQPTRVAIDNPWLPVADLSDFQEPFDKLRNQRPLPQINRTEILIKAKLKRDSSQGKHPVVVVGWLRELRSDEPDWQMPWPVNLPLLPPERELFSIPMIVACKATKPADSALGYSGVHHARQRFKVLEVFHGDAKVGEELDLRYSYLEPEMGFAWSGRDVKPGECVIWVVSGDGDGIHGYGAVADTPHNRQVACDLAARVKAALPQTRFDLLDLDLSKARITANQPSEVGDVFDLPAGETTWQIRKDVKVVYSGPDGEIYFVPEKKVYYLRRDLYGPTGTASHYYFGPFKKDPSLVPNRPPSAQPGNASGNLTDPSRGLSPEGLLAKAAEALKAVQMRVKEDRILRPLSAAKSHADGPKSVGLVTDTPESWADFPTKPEGTTRGSGRLRISVYANLPGELPCTPFMPPKGCYWGSTYLLVPGTSAKVLIETVTSDSEAQRRLINAVIGELAKVGITAQSKDSHKLDPAPQQPFPAPGRPASAAPPLQKPVGPM